MDDGEYSLFVSPFCNCSKKILKQMVDIVSLQKMVLYWIHLRSINMSSELIFHLQKTFPMSIFDFQVHLCTDGNPPNMLPHNCKPTHFCLWIKLSGEWGLPWVWACFAVAKVLWVTPIKGTSMSLVRSNWSL